MCAYCKKLHIFSLQSTLAHKGKTTKTNFFLYMTTIQNGAPPPTTNSSKMSQKKKRKQKKQQQIAQHKALQANNTFFLQEEEPQLQQENASEEPQVEIEYVSASMINENDPRFEEFAKIFSKFTPAEELTKKVC